MSDNSCGDIIIKDIKIFRVPFEYLPPQRKLGTQIFMKKSIRKGIWIPDFILEDEKLDAANKIIMAEITSLCELEKGCYASDEHFASLVGIERSSTTKRIKKLVQLGYVTKRTLKGKGKYLFLNEQGNGQLPVPENTSTSSLKVESHVPKSTSTSSQKNTINSTTNTVILKQELVQESVEDGILSKSPVCQIMTQAQAARARINNLEDLIIKVAKSGVDILSNAKYLNEKKIWEYVENRSEYEKVVPLWKELVYLQNALYGK